MNTPMNNNQGQSDSHIMFVVTILAVVVVIGVVVYVLWPKEEAEAPEEQATEVEQDVEDTDSSNGNEEEETTEEETAPTTKVVLSTNIKDVAPFYTFSVETPTGWAVEAVPATDALNFYDPEAVGDSTLEKSQVFVRYFEASSFLTLSTVDILSRRELTTAGRPAVEYDIQKKAGVANFPGQPSWRNQRHIVTDIRESDTASSVFYVVAKNPSLSGAVYQSFLESVNVDAE